MFIQVPKKVYSAIRQCFTDYAGPIGKSSRYREFVRLGITAYDFTLTWSNQYWLVHVAWPKPKDAGNQLEGWHIYLSKYNYAFLENGATTEQLEQIVTDGAPFRYDVLNATATRTLFDNLRTDAKAKGARTQQLKTLNAKYLRDVAKLFAAAGVDNMQVNMDFGMSPMDAVIMSGQAGDARIDALIMPIRR